MQGELGELGNLPGCRETESALKPRPVDQHRRFIGDVVVAVDKAQVRDVHRILAGLLRMAGKPNRPDLQIGPVVAGSRDIRQLPLRRSSSEAPPTEDQAFDLTHFEEVQLRGTGGRSRWRGHALPAGLELEPVKRTDESPADDFPPGFRSQIGPQVRTHRSRNADLAGCIRPDDDLFTHPGPLNQPRLLDSCECRDEVPAFREWRKRTNVRLLLRSGGHRGTLSIRSNGGRLDRIISVTEKCRCCTPLPQVSVHLGRSSRTLGSPLCSA